MTITLLQTTLAWHDPAANRAHFGELLRNLPQPTDLAVLPEMFTTGFTMQTRAQAETMTGPTVSWLADLAQELGITLGGSLIVEESGAFYNRFIWMPPDGRHRSYDKRHLFRMAGEHEHFAAGSDRLVVDLKGWRVCPLVCYDLRFPVWSRGANAFDLLLYVANWPAARRSAWQALLPARAVENQCYVAGVNRIGTDGQGVAYAGDSGVYDYLAQTLADLASAPGQATVTLGLDALHRYREKFPAWRDADPFTLL
ncbi:MAG: amidohydrolase [Gammaproteobacteria bacterium]